VGAKDKKKIQWDSGGLLKQSGEYIQAFSIEVFWLANKQSKGGSKFSKQRLHLHNICMKSILSKVLQDS
jgi:hypothetical protein